MLVAYVFLVFFGLPFTRLMSRICLIPTKILAPAIVTFTLIGAFSQRKYMFDIGLALIFGIIGYIMKKTHYPPHAILLGVLLGPLAEQFFLRAILLGKGDLSIFFSRPVANFLWILLAVTSIVPPMYRKYMSKKGG